MCSIEFCAKFWLLYFLSHLPHVGFVSKRVFKKYPINKSTKIALFSTAASFLSVERIRNFSPFWCRLLSNSLPLWERTYRTVFLTLTRASQWISVSFAFTSCSPVTIQSFSNSSRLHTTIFTWFFHFFLTQLLQNLCNFYRLPKNI